MARKPPDKLSIESSKAIAAGMSYGKWKALQSEGLIQQTEYAEDFAYDDYGTDTVCPYCGNTFRLYITRGRKQKYCSRRCEQKANYKYIKVKDRECAANG